MDVLEEPAVGPDCAGDSLSLRSAESDSTIPGCPLTRLVKWDWHTHRDSDSRGVGEQFLGVVGVRVVQHSIN